MAGAREELLEIDFNNANELFSLKNYSESLKIYKKLAEAHELTPEKDRIVNARIEEIMKMIEAKKAKEPKKVVKTDFKIYDVSYSSVIGLKRQKKIIHDYVSLSLKNEQMFKSLNIKKSAGIILYGPVGTGKTVLVKAVSKELNIPMADIKLSDVISQWIGVSEQNLKIIFQDARKMAPCILFFDEIDRLGASSESTANDTSSELKNMITAFQKEISELYAENVQVYLFGATNKPWDIDIALKRSGRFDHVLYVKPPSFMDRYRLIKYYLTEGVEQKYLGRIDYFTLALCTCFYSPADIEKITKAVKIDIIKNGGLITTRRFQKAMKDRELARSSLEDWYRLIFDTYLRKAKYKKIGKDKQMVSKAGSFSNEQKEMYKAMKEDVMSYYHKRDFLRVVRFLAKGF